MTHTDGKEKASSGLQSVEAVDTHTQQGERIMTSVQDAPDNETPINGGRADVLRHLARLGIDDPDEQTINTMQRAIAASEISKLMAEVDNKWTDMNRSACSAGLDWCDGDTCHDEADYAIGGVPFHQQLHNLQEGDDVAICWGEADAEAYLHVLFDVDGPFRSSETAELTSRMIRNLALVNEMDNKLEWINNDIQARRNEVTC